MTEKTNHGLMAEYALMPGSRAWVNGAMIDWSHNYGGAWCPWRGNLEEYQYFVPKRWAPPGYPCPWERGDGVRIA